MTSEFIHEEISIMNYHELSQRGGGVMTEMDDEISIMDYNGQS